MFGKIKNFDGTVSIDTVEDDSENEKVTIPLVTDLSMFVVVTISAKTTMSDWVTLGPIERLNLVSA
jgi:hypothetical protein